MFLFMHVIHVRKPHKMFGHINSCLIYYHSEKFSAKSLAPQEFYLDSGKCDGCYFSLVGALNIDSLTLQVRVMLKSTKLSIPWYKICNINNNIHRPNTTKFLREHISRSPYLNQLHNLLIAFFILFKRVGDGVVLDDGITMMRGSLRRYAILLLSLYSAISSNDIWLRRLAITFYFLIIRFLMPFLISCPPVLTFQFFWSLL